MPASGFWSRVREARSMRVLLVYLAAAWGVLQFTSLLREELDLPRWVTPTTLLVLLVGLVVVVIASWAHGRLLGPRAPGDPVAGPREIELGEAGRRWTARVGSRSRLATFVVALTLAVAVLLGAARLVVLLRERGGTLAPGEAVAESAAPAIAVLPFSVRGQGLDVWREGMVDLVSTNLDQVAGLRAIDSRTVLARWREQVRGRETPDLETALGVARATRARYALVGGAVSIGPDVRLSADIYELPPGSDAAGASTRSVWQGQVQGPPDSVLTLVDQLSVRALGAILERRAGAAPRVDLESITTRSVPALKAYLAGEGLLRQSDFTGAISAFERAVAADSLFALAWYRLGTARGWLEGLGGEGLDAMVRAARLSDRLPEREAALVGAALALERGRLEGLDSLARVTARYPDDAEAWYLLGDSGFHLGTFALIDPTQSDKALERAIALDPTFAPAYPHLIDHGFWLADSARVATYLDGFDRLVPAGASGRGSIATYRFYQGLVFGDSASRERSLASLDTLPPSALGPIPFLRAPRFLALQEKAFEKSVARPERELREWFTEGLFFNHLNRGKLAAAYRLLDDPATPPGLVAQEPFVLYVVSKFGVSVPPERYERALGAPLSTAPPDVASFEGPGLAAFYQGAFAADRGRWKDQEDASERLREYAEVLLAAADSSDAELASGAAEALDGYAAWLRGHAAEAVPTLQAAQRRATSFRRADVNFTIRLWLGTLLLDLGRPREAAPYFRSLTWEATPVYRELGMIYEQLGRAREAREAYERFAIAFQDADPEFRPTVDQARSAAARLRSVVNEGSP